MRNVYLFLLLAGLTANGQTVRKIKITDLEQAIAQSDHPMIINFWATFCVPCCKEIPYFQTTVARYAGQKVELILVSLDLPDYYPARIAGFAQSRGFTSRILWLDETNADYFCPKVDPRWTGGIPCSLFINNKTHYRRFFDRQLTEPQVELEVRKLVAVNPG
ncbi:MAG TPA: TlpA disulfide reductase family protein [Puia sp.]|jgi:thiol-disulfide isomerase/thioredoxin|nr:TlpA disulfide reductase family protein [Puia sp.]